MDNDFNKELENAFKNGINKNGFATAVSYVKTEAKRIEDVSHEKAAKVATNEKHYSKDDEERL